MFSCTLFDRAFFCVFFEYFGIEHCLGLLDRWNWRAYLCVYFLSDSVSTYLLLLFSFTDSFVLAVIILLLLLVVAYCWFSVIWTKYQCKRHNKTKNKTHIHTTCTITSYKLLCTTTHYIGLTISAHIFLDRKVTFFVVYFHRFCLCLH